MRIRGSLPVIPTPFYKGEVDYESLLKLFEHLFPALDGYTLCGSTGESVSLSMEERLELMDFAARHTPPGKTIVVGLTHTNLNDMTRLARHAEQLGIAGGLVPCPYYFPNSFPMVLEFFRAVDRASGLELVLYDNPISTKTWLRAEELFTLIDACPHLNAVKITDLNLSKITALKKNRDVSVFSGEDAVVFRSLLLGVDGSMIIVPGVFPAPYQEVVRQLSQGDERGALRLFSARILPLVHLLGLGDEIPNTKALYKHLGIFRSAEVRLPLLAAGAERVRDIVLAYEICQEGAERGR